MSNLSRIAPILAALGLLLTACDEVPTTPGTPDRLRVVLVTATTPTAQGTRSFIYEIDEEGTVLPIVQADEALANGRYTNYLGTRGSISYQRADGRVVVRHLESGSESVLDGDFIRPRFSPDAAVIAYGADVSEGGETAEQVFILDRASNQVVQVTHNECTGSAPPDPCAWSASRPIFGEEEELYMVRRLRTADGDEQIALAVIGTNLIEQRYMILPAGTRELFPNSFFEGALLVDYVEHPGTPEEVRGFYAVRARTGDIIDNEVQLRDANYCYDANIVGISGNALRFVDVAGDELARLSLPAEYGTEIQSIDCSFQSKDLDR